MCVCVCVCVCVYCVDVCSQSIVVQFAAEMAHLMAASIEMAHLIGCTSCVCVCVCVCTVLMCVHRALWYSLLLRWLILWQLLLRWLIL